MYIGAEEQDDREATTLPIVAPTSYVAIETIVLIEMMEGRHSLIGCLTPENEVL